ncbi:MAG: hypothetical protein FWC97_03360 [Treponema sp.]|nr:hypothetical protein [Treponema sp.]
MNQMPLLLLFIYSSVAINLLLQCGLGIKETVESKAAFTVSGLIKTFLVFLAIVSLWLLFSKVVFNLVNGFFIFVLMFPVTYVFYDGLEYFVFRYIYKKENKENGDLRFSGGIAAVALFLCMVLANNFLQVVVLSLGFTSGIFLVNFAVFEIRKRAALEAVPVFLRGKPLVLITMGMLSLIFTSASLVLFRMIGS